MGCVLTRFLVCIFKSGYPNLAAFKNSDEDFTIYRRFGYLQSRILLDKQDQLRVLEARLDKFDEQDYMNYTTDLESDYMYLKPRQELLQEIEAAFSSYGTVSHNPTIDSPD